MNLSELLDTLTVTETYGGLNVDISEITMDSRQVKPGSLFVAVPGLRVDGHAFAKSAVGHGAVAVVGQRQMSLPSEVAQVVVPDTRQALALLSAAFHGFPARRLRVIGVTGTDGKTTTCSLIGAILEATGYKTGLITTVNAKIGDRVVETGLHTTTPDPPEVQGYLAEMVAANAEYVVLETTSHGLHQGRTLGSEYDVAVVTNVTHEHLDYHGTYEEYLAAKGMLFEQLNSFRKEGVPKVSVTNADDSSFEYLRRFPADIALSYGLESVADVYAARVVLSAKGITLAIQTPNGQVDVRSSLLGKFNAYNILAAVAVAVSQGIPFKAIRTGVRAVQGMPGRMESIDCGQDFAAIVDFAHTPGSLEQALELARTLTRGRVIVVFGCAGLRDRGKRPLMGEIAGKLADLTVITAEDPRTEDLSAIMAQIEAGIQRARRREGVDYWKIGDRAQAIDFALRLARSGDLVIVTGKGHEKSMCFDETEYPWSDQEAIRRVLRRKDRVA
ncbi:MAG: UDP-N-acetylmuramoyl-L-alanyl-D-glutamate--2,6-diaminopimelate ligase [Chloroflexi bacterium]|nr:UDP-N-acetylmuramoyl-L-alanyl-D-glutamate--2,6-diaminopimelate ligase [Chloroflexota bacterium]